MASLGAGAEPVPVVQKQGAMHGFLVIKDEAGTTLAVGDQINVVHGNEIVSRLVFHFRDGSIDDEVTTFRQRDFFRLVRDHHVQKGPSFPKPMDMTVDVPTGTVSWVETDHGKTETKHQHMDLPGDLANGMISLLAENLPAKSPEMKVSYLAVSSKPRIVQWAIWPDGDDRTVVGDNSRRAKRLNIHVEIGGVAGAVAPLIGKQPPDIKIWTLGERAPVFIKMVGPLYEGGPIWTMLPVEPRWPSEVSQR